MFKGKINLGKFVSELKEELKEEFGGYRDCLEAIRNDKEFLTEEDKKSIIEDVVKHGWGVESALENRLKSRYRKEAKLALVEELFPEYYKELSQKDKDEPTGLCFDRISL